MRRRLLAQFQHVVAAPEDDLTRLQRRLRYAVELVSHCRSELARVRAEGMAAELTYRTIFSLIPVLVLGLVLFRAVGGIDEVQTKVEDQLYSFFGVPDIPDSYGDDPLDLDPIADDTALTTASPPLSKQLDELARRASDPDGIHIPNSPLLEPQAALPDAATGTKVPTTTEGKRQVRASIRAAIQEATDKVSNIDFASIGIIGLGLFVYTAVTLANSVEQLFNIIYEVPTGRPAHIRLAIHWSLITLGGGLLMMSLYMSGQFIDYMGGVVESTWFSRILNHSLSMLASWVLLFLLYALMPNAQVSIRAAAAGALVSSVLWEIAKFGFQIYVARAVPYSALYGSLGLIPLFLFWVYVTWMLVLFGLVLTKTLQTLHGRSLRRLRVSSEDLPNGDPDWMIPIMAEVARAFADGHAIELQEIVERLQVPGIMVHPMLDRLEKAGLIRRVMESTPRDDQVTLAKPAQAIRVADILAIAHQRPDGMCDSRWRLLDQLNAAQRQAAGTRTLADVV